MKKGIILIDQGFQDAEVIYPYYRLKEAEINVDLVGPEAGKEYQGKYGYTFTSDKSASETVMQQYEVIVIPGGWAPDHMRRNDAIVNLVKQAEENNKVIAAICHAAQLLVEADVVKGKTATCFKGVATDLKNAGADYKNKEVVVDQNLVTSRHPGDLPAFMRETLKLIQA